MQCETAAAKKLKPSPRSGAGFPSRLRLAATVVQSCRWRKRAARSGCGIIARTRPVASRRAAASRGEPFGLWGYSPSASLSARGRAYWRAICPLSARLFQVSEAAMKRPSPWATGRRSFLSAFVSHGLCAATPVRETLTNEARDSYLRLALGARETAPSPTRPSLRRTWQPLQTPRTRPPPVMNSARGLPA